MKNPENNRIMFTMSEMMLKKFKMVEVLIYDRMCKVVKEIRRTPYLKKLFKPVKILTVDKWHGKKHTDECECNPYNHDRLWNALDNHNSTICESTFAWFRGYARTVNEMSELRNRFVVLAYVKEHNECVKGDDTAYLNEYSATKPNIKLRNSYPCTPKKQSKTSKQKHPIQATKKGKVAKYLKLGQYSKLVKQRNAKPTK